MSSTNKGITQEVTVVRQIFDVNIFVCLVMYENVFYDEFLKTTKNRTLLHVTALKQRWPAKAFSAAYLPIAARSSAEKVVVYLFSCL